MSDTFDPGPGWREIPLADARGDREYLRLGRASEAPRVWVREEPVPPLPTAPYTVIRVTWAPAYGRTEPSVLVKQDEQGWYGDGYAGVPEILRKDITSFEVLSEPRAVTAKAVLARVYEEYPAGSFTDLAGMQSIAREFGVES